MRAKSATFSVSSTRLCDDGRSKHVRIGSPGEPELGHGERIEAGRAQLLRQRRRIHLVERQPHRASAAAVSRR